MISLSEMAAELDTTAKTFSKDVKDKKIPCVIVGARKKFDPATVKAFLAVIGPDDNKVVAFNPVRKPGAVRSRFAEAVGL